MTRKLGLLGILFVGLTAFTPQKTKKPVGTAAGAPAVDYKALGAPRPDLRVVDPKGSVFTHRDIDTTGHFFMMLFNPTCGHCEDVTLMLEKHLDLFKDNQLVLISGPAMMPYLDYFQITTKVFDYPRIRVGVDSAGTIEKTFVYNALPQINVYDKQGRLQKIFSQEITIDSLKPYLP
ncbi:MAG: hypothetical protein EOP52_11480 [Sphingobacteriales bacterium]|nr:MAG: hypothetical protein EOP52_11480 [Sphingobacteriales bacterium]